ncbi:MAG: electron transport complex subunit E [Clostridia bacterium]|nr:electron transport complex subunit E [Clostridia bacterium]
MNIKKQLKEGIIDQNPILVQFLGTCSSLAVTTSVTNAIGMGVAFTVVLIFSNMFISLFRKLIPSQVRIASFVVIISGFVTAIELVIKAFFPAIDKSLGLFIPLIVVNCIILARAESFASKNGVAASIIDGVAIGLGYTFALIAIAFIRELLGTGVLFAGSDGTGGIRILGDWYTPASIFILPPGAFLTLGFLVAMFKLVRTKAEKKGEKSAEADESFEEEEAVAE